MTKEWASLLSFYEENGVGFKVKGQEKDLISDEVQPQQSQQSLSIPDQCKTLEELKSALQNFDGCLLKATAINLVFGEGNPHSDLMLVGEAPGAEEDIQGRPFVGQSGQLLDKVLKAIGITRDNCYIANIIPWRPPANRPPTTEEIAACQPFIERHIQLVKPKVLVFLGGVAAKTLLGRSEGITKLRGQIFPYLLGEGTKISAIATYHPAFLLRSPGQKASVWRDFLQVKKLLCS